MISCWNALYKEGANMRYDDYVMKPKKEKQNEQ